MNFEMNMKNIVKEEMKTEEMKTTCVEIKQQKNSKSFWQKTKSFFSKKIKQFNQFNKKPM